MHPYIENAIEIAKSRNTNEPLFLQAVKEVLESLSPVAEAFPEFHELNIWERIVEPERQHIFKVVWEDDKGRIHMNRGFRIAFNGTLGPNKGGLRFHPTVNIGVIKFLAFEQVFKNSLTGLQIGGGKGGADFDPKGKSDNEVMRFCQSFMTQLFRHIGARTDVPAGDIGVGGREISYLFGQYKRLTGSYEMGVLTGKGAGMGGSLARTEATGYGCAYFAKEILERKGEDLKGKTCLVSGSGNVALYAIQKLQQLGAKVVSCSDSGGSIYDKDGIDFDLLKEIKEVKRQRLTAYKEARPNAEYKEGEKVWSIPCDYAFPCATQNELTGKDAETLIANGCRLVCEGANMPTDLDGVHLFQEKGVLFAPGKAANAGGVAVSGLEMAQNASMVFWSFKEVDEKLQEIMKNIHKNCVTNAEKYSTADNYVAGANITGFLRVAHNMVAQGIM